MAGRQRLDGRLDLADALNAVMRIKTNANTILIDGTLDTPANKKIWKELGGEALPLAKAAYKADKNAYEGKAWPFVLAASKPWTRDTHKLFPAPARARAVELVRWGFRFSRLPHFQRQGKEQAMYELWMTNVMPNEVTRDYQPPASSGAD